jgi:DNA-binding IclR family transcriptional regulator
MQERPGVKSDRTLFEILEVLRERGPIRLTAVASELGVAKSTVHSHLAVLQERDFAVHTEDGYDLGLRLLDYGLESRRRQALFEFGRGKVDELAEQTGERSWCIVEEDGMGVYLYGATGKHAVSSPEDIGTRRPLHHIAAGKAIMANLPSERVDEIVEQNGITAATDRTITDREDLAEELAEIRERGVAYNLQEGILGVHAIAAPVLDTDGSVFGSISIAGPANRLTRERLGSELRDLIRGATNEVAVNIRT